MGQNHTGSSKNRVVSRVSAPMVSTHKTIGVLMRNLNDSKTTQAWDGISQTAQAAGVNVICFEAGMVHRNDFSSSVMSKVIAQQIQPGTIDGLITMQYWSSQAWFEEFCHSFLSLPIVTITRTYPGYSGVKSNTYQGVRTMISHLVEKHGYRKFLCLPGQLSNFTHRERHTAYEDALRDYGLDPAATMIDPALVQDENWTISVTPNETNHRHGRLYMSVALDRVGLVPGRDFDVLVTTHSDTTLLGAVAELQERGYRIPRDLACAGVENIHEGNIAIPALSTVGIDWHEIGSCSVRLLLERLQGAAAIRHVEVSATMEFKRSCGCYPTEMLDAECVVLDVPGCSDSRLTSALPDPVQHRHEILTVLELAVPDFGCGQANWAADLYDSLATDLANDDSGANPQRVKDQQFLSRLEALLIVRMQQHRDLQCAHKLLSLLQQNLRQQDGTGHGCLASGIFWQQCRLLVSFYREQAESRRRLKQDHLLSHVQRLGQLLINTFDTSMIMAILTEELPRLGINRSYLSLYEDPLVPHGMARLVMGYDSRGALDLPPEGISFLSTALMPEGIVDSGDTWSLIVEPLYFEEIQIGFVLFDTSSNDATLFDMLRGEISSALKGSLLMQRVNQRSAELQEANTALQASLSSLQMYQSRIVQSEKMAALGQLVAGIAHEVNTPIGVGVTAASFQELQSVRMQEKYRAGAIQADDFARYLEDSIKSSQMVFASLQRAADLIQSFKRIAVDQTIEEEHPFQLLSYLEDVVKNLSPRLKPSRHKVKIICSAAIEVRSSAGAYYQVFSNLILNSVMHGFENRQGGTISIRAALVEQVLLIAYEDDGAGMSDAVAKRMFDPFFTTKRGQGGTGLGMHIVYNLITQKLQGTIECSSMPGKGTRFEIRIPL